MKRFAESFSAPLLIVVVTLVTYGILLTQLGFYRDDWYLLATAQSEGSQGIISLFQIDRPLLGYLYAGAYQLLGVHALGWQIATLVLRIVGNLLFWQMLRMLWPSRTAETLAITLLFSVYPGYSVQPNAGVYSTDLAANAAALLSFVLLLIAMRTRGVLARIGLYLAAGALEILYLGIFESAVGMEVARFAIVCFVLWKRDGPAIKRTLLPALRADLLYILLAAGFLFWRLFVFQSTRRATNLDVLLGRYANLPVRSTLTIVVESLKDIYETTVLAWTVPFYRFVSTGAYRDLAIATLAAVAVVALIVLLARRPTLTESSGAFAGDPNLEILVIGAVIVVSALLPIDLAGRNVLFADQWDRYTLYASSGVALVVGAAVFRFLRSQARTTVILVLIAMSVYVHYYSAAWYRDFWAAQRDLWQQLVWRAPGIRGGTMLFVSLPTGGYQEGYEIYGPANMIYFPRGPLQIGADVINAATVTNLQLQKNRQHYDRSVLVADNYRNALVVTYPLPVSCMHVLDGRKIELPGPIDDSLVAEAAAYSQIDRIDTSATPRELPQFLRGHSPRPWCAYYQGMDLARQSGDWQEVARLADEALSKGLTPEDVSEWMPALEAYATLGRLPDMRRAAAIIRSDDASRAYLCLQLQRGAVYPGPYDYNQVNQALCQAN
ncbi:MAG TPA: hypothetical protein VFH29_05765 [Anaerolineales bacterium]|nr:hypothetical protein [Anaerolineales bacterium]